MGDGVGERERVVEALVKEAEGFLRKDSDIGSAEGLEGAKGEVGGEKGLGKRRGEEVPKPVGRVGEADRKGDLRSLSRRMERTLYLLVQKEGKNKGKEGGWGFPRSRLGPKESLYTVSFISPLSFLLLYLNWKSMGGRNYIRLGELPAIGK